MEDPLPRFTGIDHEHGSTILDETAHQKFDTTGKGQALGSQRNRLATAVGLALEQAEWEVLHQHNAVRAGAVGLVRSATQDLDRMRDWLGHQAAGS